MDRLLRYVLMICVLAGCSFILPAQDTLVFPPAGLPEEIWNMSFHDYNVYGEEFPTRSGANSRMVTFVWDDDILYIKGIFRDYPDSWIRGTLFNKKIMFDRYQLICELDTRLEEPEPVYGMNGVVSYKYREEPGIWYAYSISFNFNGSDCGEQFWAEYLLSDTRDSITSKVVYPAFDNYTTAFWYNTAPNSFGFSYGFEIDGYTGSGFPDRDYPTRIQFTKISGSNKDMSAVADGASSESVTYDLYGRRVNPDKLRPGIYIRNGEKILVK